VKGSTKQYKTATEARIYQKQRISDIIDCNVKKDYQILTIFGTNIPETTGYQTAVQVLTSPDMSF